MGSDRETSPAATARSGERPGVGTQRNRHTLEPTVVDDWPDMALVAPAELDVIETYLGSLLDEILTPPRNHPNGPTPKCARPISQHPSKGH